MRQEEEELKYVKVDVSTIIFSLNNVNAFVWLSCCRVVDFVSETKPKRVIFLPPAHLPPAPPPHQPQGGPSLSPR